MTDTIALEQRLAELGDGLLISAVRALADADLAHDAVQETMIRVLAVLHGAGIPDTYTLETYTYGTLRHVIADARRRQHRLLPLGGWLRAAQPSPLETLVSAETTRELAAALSRLDEADRTLLHRCYVNGEKLVDIAAQTGEPADRLRKRKSRALEKLRGHILKRGPIE